MSGESFLPPPSARDRCTTKTETNDKVFSKQVSIVIGCLIKIQLNLFGALHVEGTDVTRVHPPCDESCNNK